MPPDGYTTVTISDEVAANLSRVIVLHDLETMAIAIDYATRLALNKEPVTTTELARLLYHRLQTEESSSNR
jgi:hypothetical protein